MSNYILICYRFMFVSNSYLYIIGIHLYLLNYSKGGLLSRGFPFSLSPEGNL